MKLPGVLSLWQGFKTHMPPGSGPFTYKNEESWVWGNGEWRIMWRTGECTLQLMVALLKCGYAYLILMFTSLKSRNVNMYVVFALVSETLDRPNKKHLRDRCTFLVSSHDLCPLLSVRIIYVCPVTATLLGCVQRVSSFRMSDMSIPPVQMTTPNSDSD